MKAKFLIRDYEIDIIPEINYLDMMDGTPDTISFAFKHQSDLSRILNIKEKCEVQIYEGQGRERVGSISNDFSSITINDTTYDVSENVENEYYIFDEGTQVGYIYTITGVICLNDIEYFYEDKKVYKDLKHHYYMCISSISSDKMSTKYDNGYIITVSLKEQTILLKDCIRTDIAISPSLYPQVKNENGEYINIFNSLKDAAQKIVDCHNMCSLNEQIQYVDDDVMNSLSNIACPNLTYRDLSTYSQLYDVFMRAGRIPFYSNGTLYGIKLEGNKKENLKDLSEYSSVSSIKEESANDDIYSSKVYNNLYDKEIAVVPQIFSDLIYSIDYIPKTIINSSTGRTAGTVTVNEYGEYICLLNTDGTIIGTVYQINMGLNGIFGNKPSTIQVYHSQPTYEIVNNTFSIGSQTYEIICSYESVSEPTRLIGDYMPPSFSTTSIDDIVDGNNYSEDTASIRTWLNNEFKKWIFLNSQNENDISKTLLYVSGFDDSSQGIEDARSYGLQLPYAIEDVLHIYACKPCISVEHDTLTHKCNCVFGFKLIRYDDNRIVENSSYESLSSLQKRLVASYTRGGKKINNIVCLNVTDENDWSILKVTEGDLEGSFAWSNLELYKALKSQFYVVEYKPIMNTYYTNYDYHKGEEKPLSINNFNLPYSQVSDKQVYPILEYNLQKGLDTQEDVKILTNDISILNATAGSICRYHGKEYIINKVNFIINNVTIEGSFTLTNKIIQNSLLSSYADNVRVSSVMSAESTVDRPVHLFGENKITLSNYYNTNSTTRNHEIHNFIEDIGDALSSFSLSQLGLYSGTYPYNIYSYVSKYPFRFDNILQDTYMTDTSGHYLIKLSTGDSRVDNNESKIFRFTTNDFPLTINTFSIKVTQNPAVVPSTDVKVVNNIEELENELMNRQYYRMVWALTGLPRFLVFMGIKRNSDTEYTYLYPPVDSSTLKTYWNVTQNTFILGGDAMYVDRVNYARPTVYNYRLYERGKEYATTNYGTEKLITTSGLITKFEYSFFDSSYATNTFTTNTLSPDITYGQNVYKTVVITPTIKSVTPVFFNRLSYGCKLAGFGNKESDFYSIANLNTLYDKGYLLDLRENPRPYIQYKTIFRGDDTIIPLELNSELKYMEAGISSNNVTPDTPYYAIVKIPKFTSISNFNVLDRDDPYRFLIIDNKYCDVSISTSLSNNTKGLLECSETLVPSNNYDYCLIGYNRVYNETLERYDLTRLNIYMKFNLSNNTSTDKLLLDYEIISEI